MTKTEINRLVKKLDKHMKAVAAEPSEQDKLVIRDKALEDAASRVEDEVCGCCWPEEVQSFASHVAETIRAMKGGDHD